MAVRNKKQRRLWCARAEEKQRKGMRWCALWIEGESGRTGACAVEAGLCWCAWRLEGDSRVLVRAAAWGRRVAEQYLVLWKLGALAALRVGTYYHADINTRNNILLRGSHGLRYGTIICHTYAYNYSGDMQRHHTDGMRSKTQHDEIFVNRGKYYRTPRFIVARNPEKAM